MEPFFTPAWKRSPQEQRRILESIVENYRTGARPDKKQLLPFGIGVVLAEKALHEGKPSYAMHVRMPRVALYQAATIAIPIGVAIYHAIDAVAR